MPTLSFVFCSARFFRRHHHVAWLVLSGVIWTGMMPVYGQTQASPDTVASRFTLPPTVCAPPAQQTVLAIPTLDLAARRPEPLRNEARRYLEDIKNFYTVNNGLNYGVGLGVGAILANTSMDQDVHVWYQKDVRSRGTDDVAKFFKVFGEGKYLLPISFAGSFTYRFLQEHGVLRQPESCIGEFFSETSRSYLVGAPTLLIGQYALGAGRPNEHGPHSSHWHPFHDNNAISGHAFIGATPFLVAAQLSDRWWLKAIFYTGSVMTPLSRINDDAHFLSQAMLGWYLAYLSVRTVGKTDNLSLKKGLTIFPIYENGVGVGLLYKR